MNFAIAATTPGTRDHGSPVQPSVGSITFERADGSTKTFRIMPFLHEPGDWADRYATLADAVRAARGESIDWNGLVTFGVVQASEGAFLVRPMESESGKSFELAPPETKARRVVGSASAPELQALVSAQVWMDFTRAREGVVPVAF